MIRILKELYRKIATFGGTVALLAVIAGAGYDTFNWEQAWMPTSSKQVPAPLMVECETQQEKGLIPLKLNANQSWCQLPPQAHADKAELDKTGNESTF